ncbi:MAG: GNAT family N-acetyltransferase [Hyphomicrobiaceae bacterium]
MHSQTKTVRFHASLDDVGAEAWDRLFPGDPEDWAFYRAIEASPPENFKLGAVTIVNDRTEVIAAVPVFKVDYRLDTPFQGRTRRFADWLHARIPGLTSISVLGLGSPLSDNCSLGFAAELAPAGRLDALQQLLDWLADEATRQHANIMAIKSLGLEARTFAPLLAKAGYGEVTSVPVVTLTVHHPSLDAYLQSLKRQHRHYFRNKLKTRPNLRIEFRRSAAGLEHELVSLYEATLAQSGVSYGDFDRVGSGYFQSFLEYQGERAQLMLFWHGETLVSFHLFHAGDRRIISNKMGMRYPEARDLNLYFINWLEIIAFACAHQISEIEMGATTYKAKMLFGGHFERRYLHFRFRRDISNRLARPFHRFFDFERNDSELQALAAEGPLPGLDEERTSQS